MEDYKYIILKEMPSIKERAAEWFHSKWGVPTEAYLGCMEVKINQLSSNLFLELYTSVGWDGPGMFKMLRP